MLLQSKSNEMLIEKVMDEFSAATSLASVVVDIHGTEVLDYVTLLLFANLFAPIPNIAPFAKNVICLVDWKHPKLENL